MGDLNAKTFTYKCRKQNREGKILVGLSNEVAFDVWTSKEPNHFSYREGDCLGLFLTSPGLKLLCEMPTTIEDADSDHIPQRMSIKLSPSIVEDVFLRYDTSKTDWTMFSLYISRALGGTSLIVEKTDKAIDKADELIRTLLIEFLGKYSESVYSKQKYACNPRYITKALTESFIDSKCQRTSLDSRVEDAQSK